MFVSGNLPMSSAKIESTKPTDSRFASVELFRLWRKPVTMTSSSDSLAAGVDCAACACVCPMMAPMHRASTWLVRRVAHATKSRGVRIVLSPS